MIDYELEHMIVNQYGIKHINVPGDVQTTNYNTHLGHSESHIEGGNLRGRFK